MARVLFVCLGNICRSPTAEGIFTHLVAQKKLQSKITIDSAGTSGWHQGERADPRSRQTAKERGFDLPSLSRKFTTKDFQDFDYIIGMDQSNIRNILSLATSIQDKEKVFLLRSFDPTAPPESEVPDPYYGGPQGFDTVFDICFRGCEGLLNVIEKRL